MTTASDHDAETALRKTLRWLRAAPLGALAQLACRFGYAARGFVYVSIGVIAVLAAVERVPQAEGSLGAVEAWADWPLGLVLLGAAGIGLYGFAGWRLLQSVFDAERQGTSPKALAARAGQAVSGVVYGTLGFSVFSAMDLLDDLADPEEGASEQEAAAQALAIPGGEWLIIGVGVFILAAGLANLAKAIRGGLAERLVCDAAVRRVAEPMGRLGYGARGAAFAVMGVMLVQAGLHANAAEAAGLAEALQALERAPWGDGLLIGVALGLLAFGAFALMEARYREIPAGEVIDD
ncbi:MAG: DUF1206 domain-containing protein [Phenylobacterium sp.]|uniref:DUF1206 domain-containing protein n=1 Tax=Phenylobacterium sp. TaxID=1871053 RepID=UPI002736770E|nr:DUF1206 domain-containing protein [Phenylobacterium sp.]MDP1642313.1 DUF1206 domain-containing protein [Phenylobacterium sp.]MDP3118428.1 DUF1206 domain-containing protein [Phenylobacterium sp.]